MTERAIPIGKRQHELLSNLFTQQQQAQNQITTVANTILAGLDDVIETAEIRGVRARKDKTTKKDVFELVLDVPTPAKPQKAPRVGRR